MGFSDLSETNRQAESSFRLAHINTEIDESEEEFNQFTTERQLSDGMQAPLHFIPEGE